MIIAGNLWHKKTASVHKRNAQSFHCTSTLASTSSIRPYCFIHYFGYTDFALHEKKVQLQAFSQKPSVITLASFCHYKKCIKNNSHVQSSGGFKDTIECCENIRMVATNFRPKSMRSRAHARKIKLPQIC